MKAKRKNADLLAFSAMMRFVGVPVNVAVPPMFDEYTIDSVNIFANFFICESIALSLSAAAALLMRSSDAVTIA